MLETALSVGTNVDTAGFFGGFLKLRKSVKGKKSNKKLAKHVFEKNGIVKEDEKFFQKVHLYSLLK